MKDPNHYGGWYQKVKMAQIMLRVHASTGSLKHDQTDADAA
jgi:hypothetical protein